MLQNPELHYLDNAATTIVAPEVADVIDKAMREHWANPSSLYAPGARSEEALNAARAAVARTLGCKSKELYFTSCGSEGNNLALLGAAQTRTFGKGIVVSGFEHPSVQRPLERLAAQGYHVTVVAPQPDGTLDMGRMLEAVDKNTILVACMMVNNEIGTRNDVERLAAEVKRRNSRIIVHVDAVQAWMRVPIKLDNIDTLAVSGHKIHAPKGVGALYLSDRLVQAFQPPYLGGEQERGLRPGTENLPYAMGLAAAATRLAGSIRSRDKAMRALNDRLRAGRPVLGVCVGEQIMFERGMEHGDGTPGLGLIKGDVELLDADVVPHMGWDTVEAPEGSVLLKGVENERFYFVHSFAAMSASPADTSADQLDFGDAEEHVTWCTYGRSRFVAAYERGPLFATQFHPEKSAEAGAQLLRNWVATF